MNLFENYEEEFLEQTETIKKRIDEIPRTEIAKRRDAVLSTQQLIQDAEEQLTRLNLAARSASESQRGALINKAKDYDTQIKLLKKNLKKAESSFEREDLIGGFKNDSILSTADDQRQRLLDSTRRLDGHSTMLEEARNDVVRAIGTGSDILTNLDEQEEKLKRISNRADNINSTLSKGKQLMRSMARRVVTNKLIMALIVLVILGTIGLVIYLKWFAGSSSSSQTPAPPAPAPAPSPSP